MNIIEFFNEAPGFATVLALAYVAVVGVFGYLFYQMYKK